MGRPRKGSEHLPDETPLVVNTSRLTRVLGLSERRLQQLRTEGMPNVGRGRWDLEIVVPWFIEKVELRARPIDGTTEEARRRYYVARAGTAELDQQERRSQVISADVVEAALTGFAGAVRAALQGFAALFTDPRERTIAERLSREALDALRGAVESLDLDPDGSPAAVLGAAATKRKPVGRPKSSDAGRRPGARTVGS